MSQQHVSIFCISNRVSFQESLVGLGFIMKLSYEIWLRIVTVYSLKYGKGMDRVLGQGSYTE